MAKDNKGRPVVPTPETPADDVRPASVDGEVAAIEPPSPPVSDSDPRDVEIKRLRDELAAVKSGAVATQYQAGKRYRVTLKDGPDWVVEPQNGEHPFDAFKRTTGVRESAHAPGEIIETDLPVGRVTVRS